MCARVEWSGAGINLKTNRPTTSRIRQAVRSVLSEPRFERNAARIQADFARHNAPTEAAALLEKLGTTRRPIDFSPAPSGRGGAPTLALSGSRAYGSVTPKW